MAIVTYDFYQTVYRGADTSEDDFDALEARAEDVIGALTRWAVTDDTIAQLPALTQTLYKKAVCAQCDYLSVNGSDALYGAAGAGFTVGKVSISGRAQNASEGVLRAVIAPMALGYLEQTGLMAPQVDTATDMPLAAGVW